MGIFSNQVNYIITLDTDYYTAFDAVIKAGKQLGKVLSSDKEDGTIVFKATMSLIKMRNPAKFYAKLEQSSNGLIVVEFTGEVIGGGITYKQIIEKRFNEFKKILAPILNCSIDDLINKEFNPDKIVKGYLEVDSLNKKWSIPNNFGRKAQIYNFEDILSFVLLEDGETITSGGLGRAAVGGLVFGAAGAVVGGITGGKKSKSICTSLAVKISINNIQNPTAYISFISSKTKKGGLIYKVYYAVAQECMSILELICKDIQKKNDLVLSASHKAQLSEADEIQKFKNLLDAGIIKQEEYEMKKKQLLGL